MDTFARHPPLERGEFQSLVARAEAEDLNAQLELGERYLYGDGVEKDEEEGARWFDRAGLCPPAHSLTLSLCFCLSLPPSPSPSLFSSSRKSA